ncbi:MAG: DUF1015 domain-containing protein [Candidatus Omnitrophota bacterium]
MAEIRPFKALLYNSDKIKTDYSNVVAPPYDVIPDGMCDELYEKNAYNVIRLILGKSLEGDSEENNKYTRADRFLSEWQDQEVLVKDKADAFYVYVQEYEYEGKTRRRIGFFGLMKIEDPGEQSVIPHEHTLAKPKEDRMNLIKHVKGNLSPIFVLYEEDTGTITGILEKTASSSKPVIDTEVGGERHKLWRIREEGDIKEIISAMGDKKVYIADGHHRYEVAKSYRNARRQLEGYDGSADHVLMYFTDMVGDESRNSLTVMATHRAIKEMPVTPAELADKLSGYFDVAECKDLPELMDRLDGATDKDHVLGYFGGDKYLSIKLKDEKSLPELITGKKSIEWKQLDVSILHAGILRNLLGVKKDEGNITYVKDAKQAEALVKDGSHAAAFLLNPTRVWQIKTVSENGDMMPQKSTYFYPKLLSGLVINKFD